MNETTKKLLSLNDEQRAALYKKAFDGVDGKLLLEDLRVRCFVYDNPAKSDPLHRVNDPIETTFNCGMLAVLQHIETNINYREEEK